MTKSAVPLVALLVASAAIAGIVGLERHAASSRSAQIRLSAAAGSLNALQGLPFHADPHDPAAPEVPARLKASERQILETLAELGGPPAERTLILAAVDKNFTALARIYDWSAGGQHPVTAGPILADRSERALAPALAQLRERSTDYAEAARVSQLEAVFGSISVILILLGAFCFYYLRSANVRRREAKAYADLDLAQAERKRLLARAVGAAEDERTRIACDLHDGPIQRLTAAVFTLDLVGRKLARGEGELDGLVAQVREQLAGEMELLRRLMSDLRPQLLDEGDVAAAIRDCASDLLGPGVTCVVRDATDNAFLVRDLETVVYRVAREAIVNVQKHAGAANVEVTIARDGDRLRLTVTDDGAGFDTGDNASAGLEHHLGLIAMQERVESVDGSLSITSAPGAGTRIEAILPWPEPVEAVHAGRETHAAVA
jgi:signal transduction histidine kinase